MPKIVQIPLRNQVRDLIAEQLWKGTYAFGDDLNEARLAKELGVSRTPLREGLVMLASEGLIEAHPNRGFHVPLLDSGLVAELYPVIASLEALAVRTSTGDMDVLADDLDRINQRIDTDGNPRRANNSADADWHARLVAECPNETLKTEIRKLWARSRGIDGALLRGLASAETSSSDHANIAAEIRAGRLSRAATLVEKHWHAGVDVVTTWIDAQTNGEEAR